MEAQLRINFKGGPINGKSTSLVEAYLSFKSHIYELEKYSKSVSQFRYKYIGMAVNLDDSNVHS